MRAYLAILTLGFILAFSSSVAYASCGSCGSGGEGQGGGHGSEESAATESTREPTNTNYDVRDNLDDLDRDIPEHAAGGMPEEMPSGHGHSASVSAVASESDGGHLTGSVGGFFSGLFSGGAAQRP